MKNQIDVESRYKIAVIGLGYVGLPLAEIFGWKYRVIGFDINTSRVDELRNGFDRTQAFSEEALAVVPHLNFSSNLADIAACNIYIITVPTPLNSNKSPDLQHLLKASEMVGSILSNEDIVIYESTVYPGCTEEDCVPVLEKASGLTFNKEFYCGYSPERINPGDKVHTLATIKKITSGSTPETATVIDNLYRSVITAGTYKTTNIKVAEAAKAIENAQRDVNISFMNEIALIFDRMGIDTNDVIEAAATKWNFLPFHPGLVGGHCIGIDPHYLVHKAASLGYLPKVILSGREVNEQMGFFVADKLIRMLTEKNKKISEANILILGIAFKENCPDIRNTKVADIYNKLIQAGANVSVHDPWADKELVQNEYGISLSDKISYSCDAVVLAVAHDIFQEISFEKFKQNGALLFDTKNFIKRELVDARL